ncbi:acylneuraminate cytidylyltransferase family protein [Leeuwenhoekiella aequorea]|uniref:acylneuraminate cytidylyltransferase family protein n=1 Tax=Leeuwenhoekiella aequorea TaxID=283736 RepID=UPI00352C7FF3|tara:strand:- start:10083 stop:10775 length:693 start_codon:yes stop_codon:yes gene_type:complete
MNFLYLIPARGGSKGLPNKNIKEFNGRPLISYTIDAALTCTSKENICITTDSIEIKNVAESCGVEVPFLRPAEQSTDYASSEEVILHALAFYRSIDQIYDYVIYLQPTSPLRNQSDIKQAIASLRDNTELLVSVKETDANPYYVLFEENQNGILEHTKPSVFSRRQDCPKVYELNGAIYIINVKKFLQKGYRELKMQKFVMDKINSVDIDDIWDFKIAEFLMKSNLSMQT